MMNVNLKKPASLMSLLIALTFISLIAQITFFIIHYKVSDLLDFFVQSSLANNLMHLQILIPLLSFMGIQLICYLILVAWIWFLTKSICHLFGVKSSRVNGVGVVIWFVNITFLLSLNNHFYTHSFFAQLLPTPHWLLTSSLMLLSMAMLFSYVNLFQSKRYLILGGSFFLLSIVFVSFSAYQHFLPRHFTHPHSFKQPNIILIGLDSVRPDYLSFFNNTSLSHTPHIDDFLASSVVFNDAYTPLARTFPAWISILTAKYPKHSAARVNLANPLGPLSHDTLAKHLQTMGYETIYATDEKRFSNITEGYGFNSIIGPKLGINDFILGGLNDFPLTNLIINTALGSILFPYNYGNRAAAITYQPDAFLNLVKQGLAKHAHKPLFFAIHLCISHWPYTWAGDHQMGALNLPLNYKNSVEAADNQFQHLLRILKQNGLLENSLVVLLSDHGTTLGLPHDRLIAESTFQGEPSKLKMLPIFKLSSANEYSIDYKNDYSINTSFGQGTDILSLKQYQVVMAFKGFGLALSPKRIHQRVSLMDIAPTLLDYLQDSPLKGVDGFSLKEALVKSKKVPIKNHPLFLETGYSVSGIETKSIKVDQVLKQTLKIYVLNPSSGQLFVNSAANKGINQSKQRAVLYGDWLLARYPALERQKLVFSDKKDKSRKAQLKFENYRQPEFYVLANIKDGRWDIGIDSSLAQVAPTKKLLEWFQHFYQSDLTH